MPGLSEWWVSTTGDPSTLGNCEALGVPVYSAPLPNYAQRIERARQAMERLGIDLLYRRDLQVVP